MLDVPIEVDLAAGKARGWAFHEDNRILIDRTARSVRFGSASEPLAPGTVREAPEGWCVDSAVMLVWSSAISRLRRSSDSGWLGMSMSRVRSLASTGMAQRRVTQRRAGGATAMVQRSAPAVGAIARFAVERRRFSGDVVPRRAVDGARAAKPKKTKRQTFGPAPRRLSPQPQPC
jgi:hypothetical protein